MKNRHNLNRRGNFSVDDYVREALHKSASSITIFHSPGLRERGDEINRLSNGVRKLISQPRSLPLLPIEGFIEINSCVGQ
jgi:hypothetical protein